MPKTGSANGGTKPILVLGLGNTLLRDDGIGPYLIHRLEAEYGDHPEVDLVDGGTQGLMLLGQFSGREAVLILDAFKLGFAPGSLHVIRQAQPSDTGKYQGRTTHEGNAAGLLATAALTGDLPPRVYVLGIEPDKIETGNSLSCEVAAMVPAAMDKAMELIAEMMEVSVCV